jgi:hypothetical protein
MYSWSLLARAVWDNPYLTDTFNQDRYPLTRPFGGPAGDVDGDRDVDIFDIVTMASAYSLGQSDPGFIPNCDINGDGIVDIFDVVLAAGNYGKNW